MCACGGRSKPTHCTGGVVVESADVGSDFVEIMEALVRAVIAQMQVFAPSSKDEECACGACIEACFFGLPKRSDGLGLDMDESEALFEAFILDAFFALADAWSDDDVALLAHVNEACVLVLPEGGELGGDKSGTYAGLTPDAQGRGGGVMCVRRQPVVGHLAVEESLHFLGVAQKEKIAEGSVPDAIDDKAERALHHFWAGAHQQTAEGVGEEIGYPIL